MKFGELFYRVIIMDIKDHPKGIIIECGVLLGTKIITFLFAVTLPI